MLPSQSDLKATYGSPASGMPTQVARIKREDSQTQDSDVALSSDQFAEINKNISVSIKPANLSLKTPPHRGPAFRSVIADPRETD